VIASAVEEARGEVARADAKAGTLLTLATGALAGLVAFAQAGHLPLPAAAVLWLADAVNVGAWQESRLRLLSALAVTKYRRLRRAVDLLAAGLVLLTAAAPLVLTGGR
jgi:hypothetical protein